MSQYGPGDRPPKTKTVKVKAHTRKVRVKSLNNPIADDLAARGQGEPPPSRRPAAPSPAVKEQHAVVAIGHARNRKRGEAVRKARSEVPSAPVNLPGLPPEVRHPAGSTLPAPKQRPLAFLDKLNQRNGRFGAGADTRVHAQQRKHAIDAGVAHLMTTGRSLHKQENTIERLRQLGVVPGSSEFQKSVDRLNAEQSAKRTKEHKQTNEDLLLAGPEQLKEAGFKKEGALDKAAALPGKMLPTLAASAYQTGRAAIEDPGDVLPKTARGLGESIVSIPAGLIYAGVHPEKAAKGLAADYTRRYGDIFKNPKGFRERVKKEGAAPEALDIATAATVGGASAGRAAQGLAEAGKLGKVAERVATTRPGLRISGDTVREQPIHENFGRNAAGAVRDTARKYVQARRAAHETAPLEVRQAQEAGDVTHIRKGATKRAQHRQVAKAKGARLATMRAEGQREQKAARKNVASLNKTERRALKYAMQFGIHTPEAARKWLSTHLRNVKEARGHHESSTGKAIPKKQNEIPEMEFLLKHADEAFTPNLARVAGEEGERAAKIGRMDPGVAPEQALRRRYLPVAELLGVAAHEGEDAGAFATRVARAAKEQGLGTPGYFPSEKRPMGVFSAFAAGGTKAIPGTKAWTGALLRTGRENTSPEAHLLSIQKGIKRKHNWNLVADQFEQHSAPGLRDKTVNELLDELDRKGIDRGSVAFWNPARYRAVRSEVDKAEGGGDVEIQDPTFESRHIQDALNDSAFDSHRLDTLPSDFKGSAGWSVIPKAVYDEIHADLRPSGAVGRSYDIAKGKVSRALLANPAWLQFQVASNALMTGLAGVGPVDAIKAQAWWRRLSQAERDAIEPYIGVHAWYDDQRHLGASSNNRLVNTYRAFKTTTFYRKAHIGNPLNLLFRADNAQNNFFRRAVFYNRTKRAAYERMGRNTSKMMAAQKRIVDTLTLRDPAELMRAVAREGKTFEKNAKAVHDFLGDWTTYTARERKVFGRATMFYGFLRFSTRLAFYTMPIEHPIMSSILLQLGHLENDELKRIFGGDVPVWELGNYYEQSGRKFAAARLNPFFNALQFEGPQSIVGTLGPLASIAINQIAGKNVSFDQLYTVRGNTQHIEHAGDLSLADRLHIIVSELEKVSPYTRAAERIFLKGRQTSDSSLLFPAGTGSPGIVEKGHGVGQALQEAFLPAAGEKGQQNINAAKARSGSQPTVVRGGPQAGTVPELPALAPLPPLPPIH